MSPSFEKTVRMRLRSMIVTAVVCALAVGAAFALRYFVYIQADTLMEQVVTVLSFFLGAEVVAVIRILRYRRVLRDPAKLEAMEIAENDERSQAVSRRASRACLWLMVILLGVSVVIASFFSKIVSLTLGAVLIAMMIIYFVFAKVLDAR